MTWKWGLDGSSSQSNYKQKTSNTATGFGDSSVVMISIVLHKDISYIRPKITKQVHGELLPEAIQLLQTTEPPCDSEIMEEEECLLAESENLPDPLLE